MEPNPYQSPQAEADLLGWALSQAAVRSGLPVDGLRFVLEALQHAPRLIEGAAPGKHLRGWQLCEAVARYPKSDSRAKLRPR